MFLNKILNLNRFKKSLIMIFADICIVLFSILLCLFLRDEIYLISDYKDFIYYVTLLIVSLSIPIFVFFDLYKSKVRYMGYKAMLFIIYAVSFLAFILFIFSLLSGQDLLTVKTIFLFWLLAFPRRLPDCFSSFAREDVSIRLFAIRRYSQQPRLVLSCWNK